MNTEPDTMRKRVLHELEHARRKRDHHAKFLDSKSFFDKHEMDIACYEAYLNQSKRDTENGDLLDKLFEVKNKIRQLETMVEQAQAEQRKLETNTATASAKIEELQGELSSMEEDRNNWKEDSLVHRAREIQLLNEKIRVLEATEHNLMEALAMNTLIPRDGREVYVHLESNRHTTVKWDADMGLWEETCGDMAYPDCDIVRWAPLNWQCMPGTPGSEI